MTKRRLNQISLKTTVFCLLVASTYLPACGAKHQSYKSSSKLKCHPKRSHPQSDYLTESSEGSTIDIARRQASTELSRRLSSEVRSEVTVTTSVGQNTQDQVKERVEVSSHFRHAELIKPITQCEYCDEQSCFSTIALNRDQVAHRLLSGVNADIQRLKEAAQDLKSGRSLLRFTQAWYIAQAASQRLRPTLNQLKILQRITPELQRSEEMMKSADQERALLEEKLWLGVKVPQISFEPELPQLLNEGIQGRFSKAFETLGLKKWAKPSCPDSKDEYNVVMIQPMGKLVCSLGFIGPECKLSLGVKLSLCHHGDLTEDTWSTLKIVGVHPREMNGAMNKLIQSLKQLDFSASLAKSLSPFIIL